ncbi:uncharacterized protein VTP21DRAFT_11486 [Calcarisporiella thermophila]|uniref:uncharacterized protein n=1 Tax=Calcarisporiella thermophila TaxID=911321 RepID=UPI00374386DF
MFSRCALSHRTRLPLKSAFPSCKTLYAVSLRRVSTTNSDKRELIFESPNGNGVRLIKMFSVSATGMSLVATPFTLQYPELMQSAGISSTMLFGALFASICSTTLLHTFLSPYVLRIYLQYNPSARIPAPPSSTPPESIPPLAPNTIITLQTPGFAGGIKATTVRLRDLTFGSSLLTWRVKSDVVEDPQFARQIVQEKFWLDARGAKGAQRLRQLVDIIKEAGGAES